MEEADQRVSGKIKWRGIEDLAAEQIFVFAQQYDPSVEAVNDSLTGVITECVIEDDNIAGQNIGKLSQGGRKV